MVGVLILALSVWLQDLFRLPLPIILWGGCVNLLYGSYSLSLARRTTRPDSLIRFLILANATWTPVCAFLVYMHLHSASLLGLGYLALEGLYVGGLACLEWRWKEHLRSR